MGADTAQHRPWAGQAPRAKPLLCFLTDRTTKAQINGICEAGNRLKYEAIWNEDDTTLADSG